MVKCYDFVLETWIWVLVNTPKKRLPRSYDGHRTTLRHVSRIAPGLLKKLSPDQCQQHKLVLNAWAAVVGPAVAGMTRAIDFSQGILTVKVTNSSLYALLRNREKSRVLCLLRKKFPNVTIQDILFRMG